jgi:hypothetical protein
VRIVIRDHEGRVQPRDTAPRVQVNRISLRHRCSEDEGSASESEMLGGGVRTRGVLALS